MSTVQQYGFVTESGVDWSKYAEYRPSHPPSFSQKLFDYHAKKMGACWSIAHDVGAGAGIVSGGLSGRFQSVVVSEPNDGYLTLARQHLLEQSHIPDSKFTFLQEGAEKSSLASDSIDLIAACECIQWTDADAALQEFHRQLKVGGSLLVSYYTRPRIPDNERAEKAWDRIFPILAAQERNPINDRAFRIADTGLTSLRFPENHWEAVQRVFLNARGSLSAFHLTEWDLDERRVNAREQVAWQENDGDWSDSKGIEWFKAYVATWVPSVPESEVQEIWNELDASLAGAKTRIETPVAIVFATKKATVSSTA